MSIETSVPPAASTRRGGSARQAGRLEVRIDANIKQWFTELAGGRGALSEWVLEACFEKARRSRTKRRKKKTNG